MADRQNRQTIRGAIPIVRQQRQQSVDSLSNLDRRIPGFQSHTGFQHQKTGPMSGQLSGQLSGPVPRSSPAPVWDPFFRRPAGYQTEKQLPTGFDNNFGYKSTEDTPVGIGGHPIRPEPTGFDGQKYPKWPQRPVATQPTAAIRPVVSRPVGPRYGPMSTLARIQKGREDRLSRPPTRQTGPPGRPGLGIAGSYGRPIRGQTPHSRRPGPRIGFLNSCVQCPNSSSGEWIRFDD